MSDSGTNHPLNQLFQAVDPEGQVPNSDRDALLNVLQDLIGEDWDEVNQQLESLMNDCEGQNLPQAFVPAFPSAIATTVDPSILLMLSQNIEAATGLVSQLPNPGDSDSLNLLRQIDFHLAEASLGINDLQQGSSRLDTDSAISQIHPASTKTETTAKTPSQRRRIPWQVLIGAGCLLLPLSLRFGLPPLIQSIAPLTASHAASSLYTVTSVQPESLEVRRPDGTRLQIKLLGIAFDQGQWGEETRGVLVMLLKASGGQVQLEPAIPQTIAEQTEAIQNSSPLGVIAHLPNGTSLQEILLFNGLVRLNEKELKAMPAQLVQKLRAAQASAQSQHKNIWGDSP